MAVGLGVHSKSKAMSTIMIVVWTPIPKTHNSWMELSYGKVPVRRTLSYCKFHWGLNKIWRFCFRWLGIHMWTCFHLSHSIHVSITYHYMTSFCECPCMCSNYCLSVKWTQCDCSWIRGFHIWEGVYSTPWQQPLLLEWGWDPHSMTNDDELKLTWSVHVWVHKFGL